MALEHLLVFLSLHDALNDGASTDPGICAEISFVHDAYGLAEVAPCHFFTSRAALEKHLAYGLPVDADTALCRSFLMDSELMYGMEGVVEACIQETFPTKHPSSLCRNTSNALCHSNPRYYCDILSNFSDMPLSKWSEFMVSWDHYIQLNKTNRALARVCYASDDILDDMVSAGKTISASLTKKLQVAKSEVELFIRWFTATY
jgi:hypothetical protein